jgi:RNA polymerase sigma factor (sigma-70 family)
MIASATNDKAAPAPNAGQSSLTELVEQARRGSQFAQRQLVEEYGDAVLRVVRRTLNQRLRTRFDSLDFVQDVWVSFFRNVGSKDLVETPRDLAAFLIGIARNKVVDANRQQLDTARFDLRREQSLHQRKTKSDQTGPVDVPARQPSASQVAMAHEAWTRLVERLPKRYRDILALKRDGYDTNEIAARLNIHERTVRRVIEKFNVYERDPVRDSIA